MLPLHGWWDTLRHVREWAVASEQDPSSQVVWALGIAFAIFLCPAAAQI